MTKAKILVVAALALATTTSASGQTAAPTAGSGKAAYTRKQIHDYALTLLQIQQIRTAEARQEAAVGPEARPALKAAANAQISAALGRRDLDDATFNAMSAQVERHRSLRWQVRQTMMQELIGY